MGPYTELSLFTGYGGFALGLRLAGVPVQTVCYVEIDGYCQKLIKARIRDGYLDDAPIWDDVRTFDGRPWRESVDLLTAGFPCQPHSVAGQRRGADDERNLWPATLRVIREVGPRYVLLENVPGILANGYGGTVVGELSAAGYDCIWDCVSAQEVGAPHRRLRWWCLAYANSESSQVRRVNHADETASSGRSNNTGGSGGHDRREPLPRQVMADTQGESGTLWPAAGERPGKLTGSSDVANHDCERCGTSRPDNQQRRTDAPVGSGSYVAYTDFAPAGHGDNGNGSALRNGSQGKRGGEVQPGEWWAVQPDVGRVAHGVAARLDRLRACGNGIVPAVVAEFIGKELLKQV